MQVFAIGQRWISESEPELGLGLIQGVNVRHVDLLFPATHEKRQYAIDNCPLKRVQFKPGDRITTSNGELTVEEVLSQGPLLSYRSGDTTVRESDISTAASSSTPLDRLLAGDLDDSHLFSLRFRTLQMQQTILESPARGFVGARLDLIPHQLYIAHEGASRRAPRLLLADEVGLGKTIEAGLILHRLLLTGRAQRVLVAVPEPLVNQWFVEMLRKFNLWFAIYDEERCKALETSNPESNPFLDDQLIICAMDVLSASEKRSSQAANGDWDLVIIDEAHHLEWAPDNPNPQYRAAEVIARNAGGLLLLTATPHQSAAHHGSSEELLQGHFARLRLLDPARYFDFEVFARETDALSGLSSLADRLRRGGALDKSQLRTLKELIQLDETTAIQLQTKIPANETIRLKILDEILDRHGPGRVTFRNTRAGIGGFPKRVPCPVPLNADSDEQVDSINSEVALEFYPPDEIPEFDFKNDPRVDWLTGFLRAHSKEKVLLISRYREKVEALDEALRLKLTIATAVFHESLTLLQRDRNAAWFAEEDGAQLLLCSEIGSEGRNFQFAHHLILFDLPLEPELLEQRIGRLDRIGQKNDILIHIPYIEGSSQELIFQWYHAGLNAFSQIVPGAAELGSAFNAELKQLATRELHKSSIHDLTTRAAKLRQETAEKLEHGRDHLIELTSFKPSIARSLAAQIVAATSDKALEAWLLDVLDELNIHVEELGNRNYILGGGDLVKDKFPGLPETGLTLTASRERAVVRDDIGFLTSDHPVVSGAIDSILGTAKGNCSAGVLKGAGERGLLLETIFVLESIAPKELHASRFLSPTPIRILIDQNLEECTGNYPAKAFASLAKADLRPFLEQDAFRNDLLPAMNVAAEAEAAKQVSVLCNAALAKMELELDSELSRLRFLQTVNPNIRAQEIQMAEDEIASLRTHLLNANPRLDAIRLIIKSP
jgi:ATP-dependent helicase HepA